MAKQRYCPMCDKYVPAREYDCRACGMQTEQVPPTAAKESK